MSESFQDLTPEQREALDRFYKEHSDIVLQAIFDNTKRFEFFKSVVKKEVSDEK